MWLDVELGGLSVGRCGLSLVRLDAAQCGSDSMLALDVSSRCAAPECLGSMWLELGAAPNAWVRCSSMWLDARVRCGSGSMQLDVLQVPT